MFGSRSVTGRAGLFLFERGRRRSEHVRCDRNVLVERSEVVPMTKEELLEHYEALGDERVFLAAQPLYERAIAEASEPRVLSDYGYLLYAHARRELRRAVELYEQAIALDPGYDKPHYQLIVARAALQEPELAVRTYETRLRAAPGELRAHRFLATAYLSARAFERALSVVVAGVELDPDDEIVV